MDYRILQIALKVKSAQKIAKNFFQKSSNQASGLELLGQALSVKFISLKNFKKYEFHFFVRVFTFKAICKIL